MNERFSLPGVIESSRTRAAAPVMAFGAYILVFFLLFPALGSATMPLAILPAAAAGWFWGVRAGFLAGLLSSLLNMLLSSLVPIPATPHLIQAVATVILTLAAGTAAGWQRQLLDRVKRQSQELARERELLERQIQERQRAQEGLCAVHQELEPRVDPQAVELARTNAALRAEIGERRRTEEELRRLKEFNEEIVQNVTEGIVVQDAQGIVTFINPATTALCGYRPEDLFGRSGLVLVPPDQQHIVRQADERRLQGQTDRYEVELLRKDGSRMAAAISATPRFEADTGRIVGSLAVFSDITGWVQAKTELEKAKANLEKQNARLQTLYRVGQIVNSSLETQEILDHLTDEAMRVTRATHGQVLVADEQTGEFERRAQRGFSPEEVRRSREKPLHLGHGINGRAYATRQTICIDDVRREPGYFPLIPTTRTELALPIVRDERVLGNLDLQSPEIGAFRNADLDYLKALADQAAIALTNAQLFEAEARRRQEAETLRQVTAALTSTLDRRELLTLILERLAEVIAYDSAAVMLIDGPDLVVVAGRGFPDPARVMGLTFSIEANALFQEIQATQAPLVLDDAQADKRFLGLGGTGYVRGWMGIPLVVKGQVIGHLTVDSRRADAFSARDAQLAQVYANQAAVAIENARLYAQAQQEIAERARAEQLLQRYAARLEQSNRDLEGFAYIASHDLQEPLRKVQAFGDRLQARYADALDERGRDYIDRMQSAAARMQALINGLLSYSRVSTRGQPFERVDVGQVVQEVLSDLETRIDQVNGHVRVGPLPTLEADPMQMRQLLQNLLGNALKFHGPGAPPVVNVFGRYVSPPEGGAPAEASGNGWCEIVVADNGIGFEDKHAERIFQIFHRLHGRGEYEGTGIGLAICRKIVERHGGAVTAHATPGQGATFTVTLPVTHGQGDTNLCAPTATLSRF